jgi:acyl-coenzyme A synthetase/AMP-(fatty) acid ligase
MTSIYQDSSQYICPNQFNLAEYVLESSSENPNKTALEVISKTSQRSLTYNQLKRRVLTTGNALRKLGIMPGDKILFRLENTVTFPIAYLGAISVGIIPVPTSSNLTEYEFRELEKIIKPEAIITSKPVNISQANIQVISAKDIEDLSLGNEQASFIRGDPNRLAYIVFTSGTSGRPQAVRHAHRAIWARQSMYSDWYSLTQNDRLLHSGALNWTYTLGTGLLDPWTIGATSIVLENNSPISDLPHIIKNSEATLFAAVPGIYRKLIERKEKLEFPKLRHCLSAGEKLSQSIHDRWEKKTNTFIY